MAHAAAHGECLAKAGKDPAVRQHTRRLERRAFPVIYPHDASGEATDGG